MVYVLNFSWRNVFCRNFPQTQIQQIPNRHISSVQLCINSMISLYQSYTKAVFGFMFSSPHLNLPFSWYRHEVSKVCLSG